MDKLILVYRENAKEILKIFIYFQISQSLELWKTSCKTISHSSLLHLVLQASPSNK